MRDRPTAPVARAGRSPASASLDLVCCAAADRHLAVLVSAGARGVAAALPWVALEPGANPAGTLDAVAARLVREHVGRAPSFLAQVGAVADAKRHPSGAPLSIVFVAVVPVGTPAPAGMEWLAVSELPALGARQQEMVPTAIAALRDRMDLAPIAFRMLPSEFTLSELQQMYELLLGRRLHKASFRRALQAAYLVEPTDSWRSEGRGRPAQLFRYAPRKRRGIRRSVRFELLG
jgi:8-oxo-dGTP diphosphatase